MKNDTTILPFRQSESIADPFTELAREGARRMLAKALALNLHRQLEGAGEHPGEITSTDFTQVLLDAKVKISIGGRGRWIDKPDDRTALAVAQIRVRLSERLRDRLRGEAGDRCVAWLRQRKTPALIAGSADPGRGS